MERPFLVQIDPVALELGPLQVHWYGIAYLLAFASFWLIGAWLAKRRPWMGWTAEAVGDVRFYGILGIIIGGRLGYVLFYALDGLAGDPLFLIRIWDGGMSFHGGLIGLIAGLWWFARRTGRSFFQVTDFVAPIGPLGLAFGRLGNCVGGELWGRISDVPWAMVFPASLPPGVAPQGLEQAWAAGLLDEYARHPSQLYQASLEGLALFTILMVYAARPRPLGAISGLFLLGYGVFRFVAEFFREPDAHLGYLAGDWLTMGMLLSLPMVVAGAALTAYAYRRGAMPIAAETN